MGGVFYIYIGIGMPCSLSVHDFQLSDDNRYTHRAYSE